MTSNDSSQDQNTTEEEKKEEEQEKQEERTEEQEREELKEEVEELEESLKKVMADFDNYRKRMMREKKNIIERATEDLMKDLIEVLDDFERAMENEDEMDSKGVEMIYDKFKKVLKENGLEEIDCEGKNFDPNYHECLMSVEDEDHEEDEIIEEFQKGYKLNDKVIRPSKVKVAK
uniref:GrpE nucleotide exchange factor n=1 Tax=uncultured organism TaxID=155900 RepID=M1PV93_9ZZZZ|nr:GrpE nucleotide exchange factor [uncultured organism]